ncbi:MAG: hypothetical protein Q9227_003237 [Pyrenula ochraceoflavens]
MAPSRATSTDVLVKQSTEAATVFCESYYRTLESRRSNIASYYVQPTVMQGGKTIPTIVFNGSAVADGPSVQEIFEKQMPKAKYNVECIDCHILNQSYAPPGATTPPSNAQKNFSLVILASGTCTFGEAQDAEKAFSESFVIVPNPEAAGNRRQRGAHEFLIQSQTFREVS